MFAIYKKELRSYFINPVGYVYVGVFLALAALLCCLSTLVAGTYDTTAYFLYMMIALIILIPILTMRLFAEERKLRTEQLLLTAPVTLTGMVLGKFFAALTLYASTLLLSCLNFIPLYVIADAERGSQEYVVKHIGPVTSELIGCLIATLLIGAAFIAIGTFISALTENQLAAAIITIAVIGTMVGIGFLTSFINVVWIRTALSWISVYSRFGNFQNGLFDFAAILYYVSLAFVFLFLTIRVYEKRRWG
ncbi:MAG: ABC transporter permease [Clostridia bacterium]|nr:ABC transporter permease [Clostridia bacterium]